MERIVRAALVFSAAVWLTWWLLPHSSWLDADDLEVLQAVRADLQRLATAQDSLRARQGRYGRSLAALGFTPSAHVRLEIVSVTDDGFAATGTHAQVNGTCGLYVGSVPAPLRQMKEGEVTCQ